jgi:hypothetical protein
MTLNKRRIGLSVITLMVIFPALGIMIYFYPYFTARMCWKKLEWTSDYDLLSALYENQRPAKAGNVIIEHEAADVYRVGRDDDWIYVAEPKINHPLHLPYGDTYPGAMYLEEVTLTGVKFTFFDSCSMLIGSLR